MFNFCNEYMLYKLLYRVNTFVTIFLKYTQINDYNFGCTSLIIFFDILKYLEKCRFPKKYNLITDA